MTVEQLLHKIQEHEANVGVVGLGYVGLPVAVAFAEAGFDTLGFEVQRSVVDGVMSGRSHVTDVTSERLAPLVGDGRLAATQDFGRLEELDAVIICVPTPLSKTGDPDVSYIVEATQAVKEHLTPGQLIILESTTYPGTTREVLQSALEAGSPRRAR